MAIGARTEFACESKTIPECCQLGDRFGGSFSNGGMGSGDTHRSKERSRKRIPQPQQSNSSTFNNNGTLNNNSGGILNNSGMLYNCSTITGSGNYIQTAGQTTNNGSLSQTSVNIQGGTLTEILNGLEWRK